MFWGLIMEPNKRYTQVVEKPFHISQAAMDISTGDNDPCQVMVVVDGKNFLICTLQKTKCIQSLLDLYFRTGTSISFLTNGKCNIHLTGYLEESQDDSDDDEDGSASEQDEETPSISDKNKRKIINNDQGPAVKKAKQEKAPVSKDSDSSDDSNADSSGDEKDQLQKFLDGEDIDSDDNDESSKAHTSGEATDSGSEEEEEDDKDDSEKEEEKDDTEEKEEEQESSDEEAETTLDTSKEEKIDMSKLTKSQKKRLKKKQKKAQQPQVNGVEKTKKETPEDKPQSKAEKKKQEGKKEAREATVDKKEKKSLSGGVFIEDIKVGTGPVAKPGKTVMVHYEGRLKQNNKMFDSCKKGPGFKFRLGAKEVIAGWDVGVAGMKVGGKRKIVCPPAMAYGAKGSPPVIPSNSTLVFEVELKIVK